MKAVKKLLLISIPFLVLGCSQDETTTYQDEGYEVQVERSYEEVKDYELTWETMFDVNSESYYVYFYSITCNHCSELKNYIVDKALVRKDIYFVKGSNKDQITTDPTKGKNAENPGDIWILGYPSLIKITNKKCTKNLAGINQIKAELK